MAGTKIRGITIDIGADTTGLDKALKATNKEIKSTQTQLKDVEKLLKLDPKNVELLAQKQKLLAKATEETKSKITTLKDALQKMKDQGVDEASEAFQAMQRELIATEQELKKYTSTTKESAKATKESSDGYSVAKNVLADLAVEGIKTAVNALKELGKELVAQVGETAAYGDNISKMSQKLGLSTQAYQEWAYVLDLANVDIDSMQTGLKTLTNKIDDAKNGSESATAMFSKLGISLSDLKTMSREDVFERVIYGFQGMADSTERAALANDLFGKSGQELTPLFNESTKATQEAIEAAHRYGMIMSDDAIKASEEYEDSIATLSRTVTGLRNNLVGKLLPGVTKVTDGLALMLSGQGGSWEIADGIDMILDEVVKILPELSKVLIDVVKRMLVLITSNIPDIMDTLFTLVDQMLDTIIELLPELIPKLIEGIITFITKLLEHLPEIIDKLVDALPDIIVALNQALIKNLPLLITGLITFVGEIVKRLPEILAALFVGIFESFDGMGDDLLELGKSILNGLIWILNKAIDSINFMIAPLRAIIMAVGNMFGANWSFGDVAIPHIPQLANGGIMTQGTALVGEKGPELLSVYGGRAVVQPLTTNNYSSNLGGVNITINTQPGQSATDIADAVSEALAEQYARTRMVYV